MNRKLFSLGAICFILLFFIAGFVYAQDSRPIVRLIYFLPKDRQPQPDINAKIDKLIKDVQQHYSDEMERHGFGKKTFTIETDVNGQVVVHHLKSKFNDRYYRAENLEVEVSEQYDMSKNIYFLAVNTSEGFESGVIGRGAACGLGGSITLISTSNACFTGDYGFLVAAHELGHTFGLQHDFRNDAYLMSYGGGTDLSQCDAERLDVHPAFNPNQTTANGDNDHTTIEMLTPSLASPPNAIRFRFKVTDPDGLHQVQLLTPTLSGAAKGFLELIACKHLNHESSNTVNFVTTSLGPTNKSVSLQVIDANGVYTTSESFPIDVVSLLPPSRGVSIPDRNLAAAIREEIGNVITTHTLLNLRRLHAPNQGITDLTGLEHAHNLRELHLRGENIDGRLVNSNAISDFTPLLALTNLETLNLSHCSVSDISFLAALPQLTYLDLSGNPISNVSPLAALSELGVLHLRDTSVSDISALSGLTQLSNLSISGTSVSDISLLAALTQLRHLDLPSNISDISPLADLTALTRLYLGGSNISDISILSALTQLTFLNLPNNNISDISPLADLTQLTRLYLGWNAISDISALSGLTQLTFLNLPSNEISDISPLAGLTQLEFLNLRRNSILDVSPLVALDLPGTEWDSTGLYITENPLSYASINTHIPAMQAKGVEVAFDDRTPTVLVRISGAGQQGVTNTALSLPFVVEVRDKQNRAFAGVPVTFTVTSGGGKLSTQTVETDATGRAAAHLTLGRTTGTTTVRVTATEISRSVQFTATAVLLNAPVAVSDTALHAAITSALGKSPSSNLIISDMLKLTTLAANSANIRELTGLEHASNLTTLSLNDNNLSDIAPLAGLSKLTTLSLNNNRISDVAPLAALAQLQTLSLENNNLADITPISGLTELETLLLDNNRLRNVSALTELSELQALLINNNDLSDIAPLISLKQLKTLALKGNLLSYPSLYTHIPAIQARGAIVTVDPRTPTKLVKVSGTHGVAGGALPVIVEVRDEQGLGFSGVPVTFTVTAGGGRLSASNVVTDITGKARTTVTFGATPGRNTVRATAVKIQQPAIFTIATVHANSPVKVPDVNLRAKIAEALNKPVSVQLTAGDLLTLTELDAPNANIQNLTGLEHAHNLTSLNLSGEYISGEGTVNSNTISDFSPIAGLTQLAYLNLSYGAISDVSFLSGLTQLRSLWLYRNPITDISALAGLTALTGLGISGTAVSDVSSLAALIRLNYLHLGWNAISDISALSGLTQLTFLNLSGNAISDISALSGLTQLTFLNLSGNEISDVSPLSGLTQLNYLHLDRNGISDISALSDLTQLEVLNLRRNSILDVSPLVALDLPGTEWSSTGLYIDRNPLSYASINTHIPAMQAKGVEVAFDFRKPTRLVKISGAGQQGVVNTALPLAFVVEVRDEQNRAFAGVPVTFTVTSGGGKMSATTVPTDATGRAAEHLTLGRTVGTTTVRVAAAEISQPVQFTATAVLLSAPVTVSDAALHAAITSALGKSPNNNLTVSDMLKLATLTVNSANIRELTGLEHASNLTTLSLNRNTLSDIAPLAGLSKLTTLSLNNNRISDVTPLVALAELQTLSLENNDLADATPLSGLTQLETLALDNNRLSDVSAFTELSGLRTLSLNNNDLSDIAPLTSLRQLKTLQLKGNLLSYPSLHTHIPALQARGATVRFDPRTPTTLVNVSGMHGVAGTAHPIGVEVQDAHGFGFSGVPVTFTVTAGGGQLNASNVIADSTGRARTTLTLGPVPSKNTIRATAAEVLRPVSFSITAVDANSRVIVRDANLRTKIIETLGKTQGVQLTAGDMLGLTQLDAQNANIQNLTGLEHAHNLTSLNLSGEYISGEGTVNSNTISDFSPIAGLTRLTRLNLSRCGLSDASFVLGLTQLTWLDLGHNTISDISPLANLIELNQLYLWNNTISDVSPLAALKKLTWLMLSNNTISDVSPLADLKQLPGLGLGGNAISDISALAGLTQLTNLYLWNNTIGNVSPLKGLTQLTDLRLGGNGISDISALSDLTQLKVLNLSRNSILDVSPLVGLDLPGTEWNSTGLYIERNPLNYASVHTHIPAMQAKGVEVQFDNRAHSALVKISGDTEEGEAGTTLAIPFVVEALDPHGVVIMGLSIRFRVIEGAGHLSSTTVITDADGRAETILTLGPSPGVIKVRVTATGVTYPVTFTATATEVSRLAADVNGDGIVNIQDLVLVSSSLGQTGQSSADVNGDGVVNIQDLVIVAGALGQGTAASPSLHASDLEGLTAADIQQMLTQARQMALTDPAYLRGIAVLEQLLALLLPKEMALLPNYPNPFNPETWIPYQLAEPADVTLRIYAIDGTLVRTLSLGHKAISIYQSRSRAAYWDGRNEIGESVASGVYFYTLTAGDFTATRKMLIRK